MNSQKITLSAIGGALSTVFLLLSVYIQPMQLTFLVMSSIAIMLPLHKDFYLGALIGYIIASILGFFITGQLMFIIGYITLFGIYPILARILHKKLTKNKEIYKIVISYAIKVVYINIAFTICYFVIKALGFDFTELKLAVWLLFIIGNVVFIVYDFVIYYMQKLVDLTLIKYVLKGGNKKTETEEKDIEPFEDFIEEEKTNEDSYNSILEEDTSNSILDDTSTNSILEDDKRDEE